MKLHNVTKGCQYAKNVTTDVIYSRPEGISAHPGDAHHAVRCCNKIGDDCVTPTPCLLHTTYEEAKEICHQHGLRLCTRAEMLNNICCQGGCGIDGKRTWVADDKGRWFNSYKK